VDRKKSAPGAFIRVSLGFLAAGLVSTAAVAADRFVGYSDGYQYVLVRYFNQDGIYPAPPLLPGLAVSHAKLAQQPFYYQDFATTPAKDAAFITTDACSTQDAKRLVLCLGNDGKLSPQDQLQLLSFAASPVSAFVRTSRVAVYVRDILSQLPDRLSNTVIAQQTLEACVFACERVIVLEK